MASRDELLHKLHDGELAAAEADGLRATLTAEEQEKLAALDELGALLRGNAEIEADAGPDLWAGIEAKLPAAPEAPHAFRPGTVTPIGAARRRLMIRVTAVASALAVAAASLLWLRPVPTARPNNGCEIENLEVAGQSAAVIAVPDERGDDTTLIWFDHDETDQWESL